MPFNRNINCMLWMISWLEVNSKPNWERRLDSKSKGQRSMLQSLLMHLGRFIKMVLYIEAWNLKIFCSIKWVMLDLPIFGYQNKGLGWTIRPTHFVVYQSIWLLRLLKESVMEEEQIGGVLELFFTKCWAADHHIIIKIDNKWSETLLKSPFKWNHTLHKTLHPF